MPNGPMALVGGSKGVGPQSITNRKIPWFVTRYFRRNAGTTDYATIPTVTLNGDFVIECLVYFTGSVIVLYGDTSNFFTTARVDADGSIRWRPVGNSAEVLAPASSVLPNKLSVLKLVRDGTMADIYVNNTLAVSGGTSTDEISFNALLNSGGSATSQGILANLKIYDNGELIRWYPLNDNSDVLVDKAVVGASSVHVGYIQAGQALSGSGSIITVVDDTTWGYFYKDFRTTEGNEYTVEVRAYGDFEGFRARAWDADSGFVPIDTKIFTNGVATLVFTAGAGLTRIGVEKTSAINGDSVDINFDIRLTNANGTVVNSSATGWGLFQQQTDGDWLGRNSWNNLPTSITTSWTNNGDGSYSCDGTTGALITDDNNTLSDNYTYLTTYTVNQASAGSVRVLVYGSSMVGVGTARSSIGTYTEQLTIGTDTGSGTPTGSIKMQSFPSFNGTVSEVSVRELLKSA